MDIIEIIDTNGYKLRDLSSLNIILGKNGCGKSRLLRAVESTICGNIEAVEKSIYITPERGRRTGLLCRRRTISNCKC